MRQVAITAAVLSFFVMAAVGMAKGQSPMVCAYRAFLGSVVAFVAAWIAMRLAVDVMIKAVLSGGTGTNESEDEQAGESE